ncbi:MAG: xanthine dehydrogenase family protein molybdopterin-binding subunit [Hyphomicrobiaceae bacterium]|nr:xanthine dehydrogenase family protein molybdopterin-binding subunit [Hyphomicrobiaceae bacterium]
MEKYGIGQPVRRKEDARFITGAGTYIDDVAAENMAHAFVLRSPFAHAKILNIDTSEAENMPGVLGIITGQDWAAEGFATMPTKAAISKKIDGSPLNQPPRHCFAIDRARYIGEPVAVVIAETREQAQDAAELVEVDYEDLPAVIDARKALAEDTPRIWDNIEGNVCLDFELGDKDATEKAFANADHVVSLELVNNRVTAAPIEPRGAVAEYDATTDSYKLQNATQNVHANRTTFADVLKIDAESLHHLAPDVGGGFGAKNSSYPEPPILLYAAKKFGRPMKWVNDRNEGFQSDTHGRAQFSKVELALDKDGKFLGLRTRTVGDLGAYCWTNGPFTPTGGSARTQGGPYNIPAMYYSAVAAFTNTMPTDPYRGAGRPEASYQIERIVQHAADTLGFDPVELRRKNLMPTASLPRKTPMGLDVDSGDFPEVFDRTMKMTDREGYAERVANSKKNGMRRGFSIAPYLECSGGMPKEFAGISFTKDGTVTLRVGSHSTGMGHETSKPQILAHTLGVDFDRIDFIQADTKATPIGGGHGGSRSLEVGGAAVLKAANEMLDKAKVLAAHLLNSNADDMDFADGVFTDIKTEQTIAIDDVIAASFEQGRLPEGMEPGCLDTESIFEREIISCPNGAHAAEVEVDPETGAVRVEHYWVIDDFGPIVNPMLADGQVMGGVAQGLGQALMEEIVYDDDGQLVTGSFMDYALPRADSIPKMELGYYEDAPTAKNPLGVKGAGEAGCCASPPAIVNAVLDALKEDGVAHIDMPLTPEKVWRAISEAKK